MSDSKHTPAPWKYSFESVDPEWAIVTIDGGLIVANVNAHHRQDANARLIAAAPDLLEALKKLIEQRNCRYSTHEAWNSARAAIAKAEGRS